MPGVRHALCGRVVRDLRDDDVIARSAAHVTQVDARVARQHGLRRRQRLVAQPDLHGRTRLRVHVDGEVHRLFALARRDGDLSASSEIVGARPCAVAAINKGHRYEGKATLRKSYACMLTVGVDSRFDSRGPILRDVFIYFVWVVVEQIGP